MEQNDDDPPPFWVQSTTTLRQVDRHRRRNRQGTSLFFNTGVLVLFLLVAAVVFLVIVIPSILSLARQVFNPSLVKRSWSSLNIVLVLFAIVCGFLGRKDNEDHTPVNTPVKQQVEKIQQFQQSPRDQWYGEYQNQDRFNSFGNVDTIRTLRRSSSSYPDLRQDSPWIIKENRWRSYDDNTDVENHQFQRSDSQFSRTKSDSQDQVETKNIEVDTFVNKSEEIVANVTSSSSNSPSVVDEDYESTGSSPEIAADDQEIDKIGSKEVDQDQEISAKNVEIDGFESDQGNIVSDEKKIVEDVEQISFQSVNQPAYIPPPSPEIYSFLPPPSPTSFLWPPPSPPPPPPPPLPPKRVFSSIPTKKKAQQTFETVGHGRYKLSNTNNNNNYSNHLSVRKHKSKVQLPPQSPPPPPPPPPQSQQLPTARPVQGPESSDRKKSANVTKDFFTSFYNQSKRKRKQKRRSFENLEDFIEPPQVSIHRSKSTPEFPPPSPPPPPPPLPPPPHSVFHTLFSKKGKSKKKVHSISTSSSHPPPPPPPPPPARTQLSSSLHPTKAKTKPTPPPPPPPRKVVKKTVSFNTDSPQQQHYPSASNAPVYSNVYSSEVKRSRMYATKNPTSIPTPPPPPPPPFKMKSPWNYVMQGDYVKLESINNSPRSGYSGSEDESGSPNSTSTTNPALFMRSPDVNIKADDFIAMFRAKLKLEKLDSIKLNQGAGPSRLNPDSSTQS